MRGWLHHTVDEAVGDDFDGFVGDEEADVEGVGEKDMCWVTGFGHSMEG